ncbi:MAG: polyprenyl synthetase family protein [bacterium]
MMRAVTHNHTFTISAESTNSEFKTTLRDYQGLINTRIKSFLNTREPANLYEPIKYVLESGGKRIRPILLIFACEALGGDAAASLDAALAVELLHNFTLVHDDIMDQDDTRRGLPTVHAKWDSDVALLAGDGLVSLAYKALLQTRSPRVHEIAQIFTSGILDLCEGQALDSDFENRNGVSLDDYLRMISKKTARLLNICTKIGGIIGGGSKSQIHFLGEFGHNLGCAFQIQDDLLDIISDEQTLGKKSGSDINRKKQTYLLVHAFSHADMQTRQLLMQTLNNSATLRLRISKMKKLFKEIGSIEAAKRAIDNFLISAKANLRELPASLGRENLSHLLHFIAARKA